MPAYLELFWLMSHAPACASEIIVSSKHCTRYLVHIVPRGSPIDLPWKVRETPQLTLASFLST
jgi:hypothetical protein